jgi:hypothetical protein
MARTSSQWIRVAAIGLPFESAEKFFDGLVQVFSLFRIFLSFLWIAY